MFTRLFLVALAPVLLAGCDQASLEGFQMPWNKPSAAEIEANAYKGPPEISPLVQPIEVAGVAGRAVSTADGKTVNLTQLVSEGPGQAWRVEINGNKARYTRPDAKPVTVDVKRITYAQGIEYIGVLNGSPFALTVIGEKCSAANMGREWTLTARLKTGGKIQEGCAATIAQPDAPAKTG